MNSADRLCLLPLELQHSVFSFLPLADLNAMAKTCKALCTLITDANYWNSRGMAVWDKKIGLWKEAKAFFHLDKRQYHFALHALGPIGPTAYSALPTIGFVHERDIPRCLQRVAPTASIVKGTKWEAHLHQYIFVIGLMIVQYPYRSKKFILVREIPDTLSEWQKDYLRRLLNAKNCGQLATDWKATAYQECGPGSVAVKKQKMSAVRLYSHEVDERTSFEEPWHAALIKFP